MAQDKTDSALEGLRAREFYKYYEPFQNLMRITNLDIHDGTKPHTASLDDALAAFAQLVALRLKASRVLISCFDRDHQYVLAEGTPLLSLNRDRRVRDADGLWLGACKLQRQRMICEYTLQRAEQQIEEGSEALIVISDLDTDDWYDERRGYIKVPEDTRFYAGSAIRSSKGPVIGVLSVLGETPRETLSDEEKAFLVFMSEAIMFHLDMVRSKEEHRRTSKMVTGLGSFVEGKDGLDSTLSFRPLSANGLPEKSDVPSTVSDSDSWAQSGNVHLGIDLSPSESSGNDRSMHTSSSYDNLQSQMLSTDIKPTFNRAARIIKDAIDVDGVLFLDASVGSFGGLVFPTPGTGGESQFSYFAEPKMSSKKCPVLGAAGGSVAETAVTEGFLHGLLSRYVSGRIFNIDPAIYDLASSSHKHQDQLEDFAQQVVPEEHQKCGSDAREEVRRQRQDDLETLRRMFPNARSLAFVPLWDDHRMRWFSGCMVWSTKAVRLLHKNSELSFLRAFGITIMSEVARLDTVSADRAKSDLLNSVSHELRSPMHGILGSIECLESSKLDSLQRGLVDTIETCGRTLLDTIDHLLEFSKINNPTRNASQGQNGQSAKEIDLGQPVHLPTITEEVLETVFAGYASFAIPQAQLTASQQPFHVQMSHHQNVHFVVEIEAGTFSKWSLHTEGGAWRRLIMNLVGNSLKYTNNGYVYVKMAAQELPRDSQGRMRSRITLKVKDTGKGMSKAYLQNRLFKPFAQENVLNPGNGLGLSMVKHIVSNMGGDITVDSGIDRGTEIRVQAVMLNSSVSAATDETNLVMSNAAQQLQGLKVVFLGPFDHGNEMPVAENCFETVLQGLCRSWLETEFEVVDDLENLKDVAIVITTSTRLPTLGEELTAAQKPVIVLCENAPRTRKAFAENEGLRQAIPTAFIHQPFGPRKMANALVSCLKRESIGQGIDDVVLQRDTDRSSEWSDIEASAGPEVEASRTKTTVHSTKGPADTEPGAQEKKRLRMLLVDDNKINLQLLVRYCKSKGHDYVTAEDGVQAVDAFSQHQLDTSSRFDFVCMDISMPQMDGLEATRRIRAFEKTNGLSATKVLALTGLASAEAQQEAFSSGVDQFMTKPVRLKALGEVINGQGRD